MLEEKIEKGIKVEVQKEEKKEEKKPEIKPKQPSARLFVPVDINKLTAETPCVAAARAWDKIARQISRKHPFIASAVLGRKVTIDKEGIILIFEKDEVMSKGIANNYRREIEEVIAQVIGSSIVTKTAYFEDIEENIIDFWKIPSEKDASETTVQNLDERFPEVVENIDSSEFISYEPEKDDFEQVEIDDTDNENEEFLEENEIPDEE